MTAPKALENLEDRASSANRTETVTVEGVRITHPDKLLYPDAGITKRDLALYYAAASASLLPHIAGRPLTFFRCHKGWSRGGFFQKHVGGGVADGVRAVETPEGSLLVLEDIHALVGLAQMCVLEIHVWGAHIDALERPDFLVFDLDPDESVPWSSVVDAAFEVRDRLEKRGYEPHVKTTGGKGLHVCAVPMPAMTWDEAYETGRALGEAMVEDSPARYLTAVAKAKRKGKILLDFARNRPQATFVAPYSPRARAGAPVAMPLMWDELRTSGPTHHSIADAIARLERGDPWAGFAVKTPGP